MNQKNPGDGLLLSAVNTGGAAPKGTPAIKPICFFHDDTAVTVQNFGTQISVPKRGLCGFSRTGGAGKQNALSVYLNNGAVK